MITNHLLAKSNAAAYINKSNIKDNNEFISLLTSDQAKASKAGYNGQAFINHATKEIIIANSGTSFFAGHGIAGGAIDLVKDMVSDAQIYFGLVPVQFNNGADIFVDEILAKLGDQASEYTFITTGHSLGAVLSNLENAKLSTLGMTVLSRNIDSIGTKPIVENYIKAHNLNLDANELDIVTYNAPEHLVNTLHPEIGEVFEFEMPYSNKGFFGNVLETINNHYFKNILTKSFNAETGDFTAMHNVTEQNAEKPPQYTADEGYVLV